MWQLLPWSQRFAAALSPIASDPFDRSPWDSGDDRQARRLSPAGPWRVFLSHTSELQRYPDSGRSYVDRAERAVSAAGHAVVSMAGFGAEDRLAAEVCAGKVRACDVYVGLIGLRYGSPVRERPELSYTELEFETATAEGMPRLVFLLDDDASEMGLPGRALNDLEHGQRQADFRQRLRKSRLVVSMFRNPDHLAGLVERSLRQLAEELAGGGPGRASSGAAVRSQTYQVPDLLPYLPNRGPQDMVVERALKSLLPPDQARPITVIAYGEDHQALDRYYERFREVKVNAVLPADISREFRDLPWGKVIPHRDFERFFEEALVQCLPRDLHPGANHHYRNRLVVLYSTLNSDDWIKKSGAELVEQICRYWSESKAWEGLRLVHWIEIKLLRPKAYEKPGWRPLWLRRGYWRYLDHCRKNSRSFEQIRGRLQQESLRHCDMPATVVLEELGSVRRSCAEAWANSEEVRRGVPKPEKVIPRLRDEVSRFYSDRDRARFSSEQESQRDITEVPMQELAKFLLETIEKTLQDTQDRAPFLR